jgi:alpha-amylase/alpha-mannosidase (GH57 family)
MPTPAKTTRYITIHGHFYQPPRENPWLETVETQDSAAPYHDWNERITAECYAPNGAARMLDGENLIVRILNNYGRISFNVGPTLLSWLQENAPRTYAMIRFADKLSQQRFGGHGSAIAQVYNHIIMPLASTRDRITQIRWGIADFESRYGRKPEGMWLAETAVDFETLDLLAQNGIRFTILAPGQAARVRRIPTRGDGEAEPAWVDVSDSSVDTTQPYLVRLNEGRSIAVFFYNGPVSRAIAFEGLLNSGEVFAARLMGAFHEDNPNPQLVHVATDGESYGHHHRHGEMALASALRVIEDSGTVKLTNYAEYLALFPPVAEAVVKDNTSWSCFHGVERWRSNCGCSGGKPGFNQLWRAPLRESLDWLRDTIAPFIAQAGGVLLKDVDEARNVYIRVVLDRSQDSVDDFLATHAKKALSPKERERVLQLMELERHAQLMYTSCGWFFDDISGIETVQIIAYACRVIELANALFASPEGGIAAISPSLESDFLARLALAKSNIPDMVDGAVIYARHVKTMQIGLEQVAAHYAISSIFANSPAERGSRKLYCYCIEDDERRNHRYGAGQVIVGRMRVSSMFTEASSDFSYAVLHFGDQNLTAAVKAFSETDAEKLEALNKAVENAVASADLPGVVRAIDSYFGESAYSLTSLFRDEQRRILNRILTPTLEDMESSLAAIYRDHASLLHFLSRAGLPKPAPLSIAAQFAVNTGLRRAMEQEPIDANAILDLLEMARTDMVVLDTDKLGYLADQRMKHAMVRLQYDPANSDALEYAVSLARTLHALPFGLNLWQAQNIWYDLHLQGDSLLPGASPSALAGWQQLFSDLGRQLSINVSRLAPEAGLEDALPYPVSSASDAVIAAQPTTAESMRRDRRSTDRLNKKAPRGSLV